MRCLVLASFLAAAAATPPPDKALLFENFMAKYSKEYATEFEKGRRFQIFSENIDQIYASNAKNKTYTLGITPNADLTFDEWRSTHLGFSRVVTAKRKDRPIFSAPPAFTEPSSVDWVAKGAVTSVKNQGTCGSCWTFSTVGALEGAMAVSGRKMVDLSMQHILACDKGGSGCNGGQMDQAFDWVEQNGIPSLKSEPYLCKDGSARECTGMTCSACTKSTGETCMFSGCKKVAGSVCNKNGLVRHCECPANQCFKDGACGDAKPSTLVLQPNDVVKHTDVGSSEMDLEAAVAQQPVSVAIEADQSVFQHYTSGVLTDDACGENLDHGVLAVGYGTDEKGQKYWKVKNSWGETFGEDGFIRIEKGDPHSGGECGIRKMASFPTLTVANNIVV